MKIMRQLVIFPESRDQIADWMERGGLCFFKSGVHDKILTSRTSEEFREGLFIPDADNYYLVPPTDNMVPAPWDDGWWLCLAQDIPEGWEWRGYSNSDWRRPRVGLPDLYRMVECRPPQKPKGENISPWELIGRTLLGQKKAIEATELRFSIIPPNKLQWLTPAGYWVGIPFNPEGTVTVEVVSNG